MKRVFFILILFTISAYSQSDLTQAYLGIKINYELKDGYYTGGEFVSVDSVKVPADHFAHDALYQFEGPGWESELVGYRLYLDDRNRTDIFGKKQPEMILHEAGKTDLVSDGNESYQKLEDWGRDIFKVGNSLGIGSIAAFSDSVVAVSEYDSLFCTVDDSNLLSSVNIKHYGWKVNNGSYDIKTSYSISAGSRLTHVNVNTDEKVGELCTGIAKHENTEYLKTEYENGWNYIAIWGEQTLEYDNLGIAVFYNSDNALRLTEDNLNYLVILKNPGRVDYYFAAAWEQEKNGIKTLEEFKNYLESETKKLNNPAK